MAFDISMKSGISIEDMSRGCGLQQRTVIYELGAAGRQHLSDEPQ
jgi:hypothetical protein